MGMVQNLKTALGLTRPDYLYDGITSPFSDAQLTAVVFQDLFPDVQFPLDRAALMAIPAVARARDLICTMIGRLPLRALRGDTLLADADQPSWTYRTDDILSPYLRMVWTLDDLLFYGHSLWSVVRGTDGAIISAWRVPMEWWTIRDGAIYINDVAANALDVLYIPSHTSGLLDRAQSLRAARNVEAAVANRASSPIPVMELRQTSDFEISTDEKRALVAAYNAARRDPEGATVFMPFGIEMVTHGTDADAGFAIEGRNAARLDIANLFGIPASLLEGSVSTASLTYSTSEGKRNEFIDYGLGAWLATVEGRLSADDVVPRGQRIAFDLGDLITSTPSPTGPSEQD